MNCEEARELIGADPAATSEALQAHLSGCADCQAHREQALAFEGRLRRALEFDPRPLLREQRPRVVPFSRRGSLEAAAPARNRRLAFLTSLAAGLLVVFTLWLSRPSPSLASEIVTHVEGEAPSWARIEQVSPAQLAAVLAKSGVRLGPGMGPVVYANSCWFRGHFVPHLVVTTKSGPVTVMILTSEHIRSRRTFSEDGYSGLLVPARTGSIAILSRTPMPLEEPAADVLHALEAANTDR